MDDAFARLNASFGFDWRLYAADIRGSIAYAKALVRAGILTRAECDALVDGLARVQAEFDTRSFASQPNDEDIHTAIERRLGELVGPAAGKLHTGRSRNDQVATDVRLWLRATAGALDGALADEFLLDAGARSKALRRLQRVDSGQPARIKRAGGHAVPH